MIPAMHEMVFMIIMIIIIIVIVIMTMIIKDNVLPPAMYKAALQYDYHNNFNHDQPAMYEAVLQSLHSQSDHPSGKLLPPTLLLNIGFVFVIVIGFVFAFIIVIVIVFAVVFVIVIFPPPPVANYSHPPCC